VDDDDDDAAQLLEQIEQGQREHPVTVAQQQVIDNWLRLCDFHNNYGSDFIDVSSPSLPKLAARVLANGGMQLQSGAGTDDRTAANLLWTDLTIQCQKLFAPFNLLTAATHSTDLLTHIAIAIHLILGRDQHALSDQASATHFVHFISFRNCYFSMAFVPQSHAHRIGTALPLSVIETDASYAIGKKPNASKEKNALQELAELIHSIPASHPKALLVEPLLIPGRGRLFGGTFLQEVQELCKRHGVFIVADETLSFVRSGHNLFSSTIPSFHPDFIMIGKSIGCSLLLTNTRRPWQERLAERMVNAFSNHGIATSLLQACLVLRAMNKKQCAEQCRVQGERLLAAIRSVVGEENARGIGYCIWIDNNLDRLPILAAIMGRLLPRIDQTSDTIMAICTQAQTIMQTFYSWGDAAVRLARIFSCAICGDQCRITEECTQCLFCTRQWHDVCAARRNVKVDAYICTCS